MRRLLATVTISGVLLGATAPLAGAATTALDPGRGTGHSFIRAVDVRVGSSARVSVVQSEAQSTLDFERAGAPQNRVFRELTGAVVETAAGRFNLPPEPFRTEASASQEGDPAEETGHLDLQVPNAQNAEALEAAAAQLPITATVPETGEAGWLLDAGLTPSRVNGTFRRATGGDIHAALNVGDVKVLDGIVDLHDVGPGEIHGATSPDVNSSGTRGLQVGEITLLDLDALLEIAGLGGVNNLAPAPLSMLASRFRVNLAIGAQPLTTFGSWTAALDAVTAVQAGLNDAAVAGLGCLGLSASLRTQIDAFYAALGEPAVDCLAGVLTSDLATDFQTTMTQMLDAMRTGLQGQALLQLREVGGNTEASASVSPEGLPGGTAQAWGRVGSIIAGGEDVGGYATDTLDTTLEALEARIAHIMSSIGGELGSDYANLVHVDLLPVDTQALQIQGDYVTTHAAVSLAVVQITPPGTAPHDLNSVLSDVNPGAAPEAVAGAVDISGAVPASAVRPAPSAARRPLGQLGAVEPVSILIGSLVSDADHMRRGANFGCEGVCNLKKVCVGTTCTVTPGPNASSSIEGAVPGAPEPVTGTVVAELPRTGTRHTAAMSILGAVCLAASYRLRRFGRQLEAAALANRNP